MLKPSFITFTGCDNDTGLRLMEQLGKAYPIEWGVLLSPARQGIDPRFPSEITLARILGQGLQLSAHLCGDYSQAIMDGEDFEDLIPVELRRFPRIQINHAAPDLARIEQWRTERGDIGAAVIAQTRGAFPEDNRVSWLFDPSGGRGVRSVVPVYPGRFVGYAGGINPDNVLDVIKGIAANGPYWIDMETGVRTDNRFDLEKCRKVCELVHGS